MDLLFLIGLTGVGKSTVLPVLVAGGGRRLLPDRRQLTDRIILPAALRLQGLPARPVEDRLERFRLSARYREEHGDGIVHALLEYLGEQRPSGSWVFDGLRGAAEVAAAERCFENGRFLMLEAGPETRVQRLLARADQFDRRAGTEDTEDRQRAERIVAEEQRHYDQAGARRLLEELPPHRRLVVHTDELSPEEVAACVREWA